MKKTLLMLSMAMLMLCTIQENANAQQNALSPVNPPPRAIRATPAIPNGAGTPATSATPAVPAVEIRRVGAPEMTATETELLKKNVLTRTKWQGNSPTNPIMPDRWIDLESGGRTYIIKVAVTVTEVTIWIDPVVAAGYDYAVEKGPKVTAIELPKGIGDNKFDLWVYQSDKYVDSGVDIEGGTLYNFNEPVRNFSIRGIETSAGLDPQNETAFPTGLRFEKTGKAVVNMTSVVNEI